MSATASGNEANPKARWRPILRCLKVGLYIAALLLIVYLGNVAFGERKDDGSSGAEVFASPSHWRMFYRRGWPWEFRTWSDSTFGVVFESDWTWNSWALAADIAVFLSLAAVILLVTRRVTTRPRWSIRELAIGLSLACVALAWFASDFQRHAGERYLIATMDTTGAPISKNQADPRWFQPVPGEAGMYELRYRVGTGRPHDATRRERCFSLVNRLPDLAKIRLTGKWTDKEVNELLGLDSFRTVRELDLSGTAISDQGTIGIANCFQLEVVDLRDTNVGDPTASRLALCEHLKTVQADNTNISARYLNALQASNKQSIADALKAAWEAPP